MALEYSSETILKVYQHLKSLDVCPRCTLRYVGAHVPNDSSYYKDPQLYFEKHGVVYSSEHSERDADENEEIKNVEKGTPKRIRKNPCPTCLDFLTDTKIEQIAESIKKTNIDEYEYSDFFLNVSWPKAILLRTYALYINLKETFPDVTPYNYFEDEENAMENLSRIFRWLATDTISSKINKRFYTRSHLSILVSLGYEDEEKETKNLEKFDRSRNYRRNKKHRNKHHHHAASRSSIPELVKFMTADQFKNNFSVPPATPSTEASVENVTITADSIYLGGRYLKFSRNLCQSPWIIDGKKIAEVDLQGIIFEAVSKVLSEDTKKFTFSSSGREDVDVRMLGDGRPFYIKIDDPKYRKISQEACRKIEIEVVKSKMAAVIKLQQVSVSDTQKIKEGEETKKKRYQAICKTEAANIDVSLDKLRRFFESPVEISQGTPVRVLHRRALMDRKKMVHEVTVNKVPDRSDLFEIEVEAQAGTYIKELVNGDFNRTNPNFASVIGYPTDLVALDCIKIELDWPPAT